MPHSELQVRATAGESRLSCCRDLCYYVLDSESYYDASLVSTIAFVGYSIFSFFFTPVLTTLSDSVGRKPIFVLAAFVDTIAFISSGLLAYNWNFVAMMCLYGGGDATYATACGSHPSVLSLVMGHYPLCMPHVDALMVDYVLATKEGHAGGPDDDPINRLIYSLVRGSSKPLGKDSKEYFERELSVQITMTWVYQVTQLSLNIPCTCGSPSPASCFRGRVLVMPLEYGWGMAYIS